MAAAATPRGAIDALIEANPFHVSDRDEDVFRLREEERSRRATAREENRKLKIWQKGRSGAITERPGGAWLRDVLKTRPEEENKSGGGEWQKGKGSPSENAGKIAEKLEWYSNCYIPTEKESMADFIEKKREMFLLQMSLNIKKEEINKLEDKAQLKEQALKGSEQMLEEDAIRFDAFLKENDKRTQDAMRRAEKETKRKMEKVQEIKKFNQQIQMVQTDISKHKESLDECIRYKEFLGGLTSPEWVEKQMETKRARQQNRRRARIEKRKGKWRKEQERTIMESKEREEAENAKRKSRRRRRGKQQEDEHFKLTLPLEPSFEEEPLTSSDEEIPMHFEQPEQLMDIFSTLEEKNLFLIQSMQEGEQSLDDLELSFVDKKVEMNKKTSALEENINELKNSIAREENKVNQLRERAQHKSGDVIKHEELLSSMGETVKHIYQRLGFSDAGSSPSTLFMLSDIEARMEDIFTLIVDMPDDYVNKAEKVKEKRRRELKRVQQQEAQEKAQEERNRKAMERCMQPPKKRVGRQVSYTVSVFYYIYTLKEHLTSYFRFFVSNICDKVMYRSQPIRRQRVRQEKQEPTQDELDELRHLT